MQFTSLTNEDSTIILLGLYDIVFDFHRALLRKLPPLTTFARSSASTDQEDQTTARHARDTHAIQVFCWSSFLERILPLSQVSPPWGERRMSP
jgi:hypothetical protein